MCHTAKECIIAWWAAVFFAVVLWYRGQAYDRVLVGIIFVLGLIQLVNYGCHSLVDPTISGKMIAVLLMVLILVVALSTYIYTKNQISMWLTVVAVIGFILILYSVFIGKSNYLAYVGNVGECPSWTRNGSDIIGSWIWLVFVVVLFCLVVILAHHHFDDIGLYLIIGYMIVTALYAADQKSGSFGARWSYLLIGLGAIVWLVGIFND